MGNTYAGHGSYRVQRPQWRQDGYTDDPLTDWMRRNSTIYILSDGVKGEEQCVCVCLHSSVCLCICEEALWPVVASTFCQSTNQSDSLWLSLTSCRMKKRSGWFILETTRKGRRAVFGPQTAHQHWCWIKAPCGAVTLPSPPTFILTSVNICLH